MGDLDRLLPELDDSGVRALARMAGLDRTTREAVRVLLVRARRVGRAEERTARERRRRERRTEDASYVEAQRRMLAAAGRRAAGDLPALAALVELRDQLDELEKLAVAGLRAQGHSWADIGRTLGMARQSAWERFQRQDQPDGEAA